MTHGLVFIIKVIATILLVVIGFIATIISILLWDTRFILWVNEMGQIIWSKKQ